MADFVSLDIPIWKTPKSPLKNSVNFMKTAENSHPVDISIMKYVSFNRTVNVKKTVIMFTYNQPLF